MSDMCYYGNVVLHLQQYSHRLNLFNLFLATREAVISSHVLFGEHVALVNCPSEFQTQNLIILISSYNFHNKPTIDTFLRNGLKPEFYCMWPATLFVSVAQRETAIPTEASVSAIYCCQLLFLLLTLSLHNTHIWFKDIV